MLDRRARRSGGIIGGLAKILALAVLGLIALGLVGSMMGRRSAPPPVAGPPPPPIAATPTPTASPAAPAAARIEDCDPLPGHPVPEAGQAVDLVNSQGLTYVSIMQDGRFLRLPNPTRARVVDGRPKRCRWDDVHVNEGVYLVEVLDGDQAGAKGYAHPAAMRFDAPSASVEETPEGKVRRERQDLIDRRKAKRARSRP